MKRANQVSQDWRRMGIFEVIPVSREAQNGQMAAILKKLFPRGIKRTKIWNSLVPLLGDEDRRLSVERLEVMAECKFKLKQRISQYFPEVADKLQIIVNGDTDLLCSITQKTWEFSESHETYSQHAIVLHGLTPGEFLLDWAAQSVVTMLLRHVGMSARPRQNHQDP